MIAQHIELILTISGSITCLMVFQFIGPRAYLKRILKIDIGDNHAFAFYAGHWALLAVVMGTYLLLAVRNPAIRTPVVWLTMIEKGVLACWILKDYRKPYTKRILPAAVFDGINTLVFGLYLAGY